MELQGRNLIIDSTGEDVALLHKELIQYGYKIADTELTKQLYGDTTRDAVIDLQKKFKLVPNGILDAKTAWLMEPGNSDNEHPVKFIVIGRVTNADGSVRNGVTVKGVDKDLRSEQAFKKTDVTHNNGEYEIFYHADEFSRAEKDRADVIVRVFDGSGTVLASSPIIFNAGKVEVFDFTIGDTRGLSEFETIVREITPLLDGVAQPQLTADDIAFLSGDTGIDADLLTLIAESARRQVEAITIAQSVFYGLFRQNLPTDLKELLENDIPLLRAALELSSNQGIIAQLSTTQLDQIAEQLKALKGTLLLQPAGPGETGSFGDLLRATALTVDKQRIVAELQVQHGGSTDAFWQALNNRTDFQDSDKKDVRATLQVGGLSDNHIPLVKELRPAALAILTAQTTLSSTATLSEDRTALRPFVGNNVADWKAVLLKPRQPVTNPPVPIGAPPTIPGATPDEKMNNYAVVLNKYMEKALPTPVIAARADKDIGTDNPFLPVKTDLKTFFTNNKFYEFRDKPIDVYLNEGGHLGGILNPQALVAELKNMQRLFNIAPRYEEMRSLRKDDLHSAVSMVKVGERRFVEKYAATLGGTTQALETYRKAKQTQAAALNFYLRNVLSSNSPGPFVVPNGTMKSAVTKLTTSASPDLPTLFGSLDLCDCEQCQSVYSPAAYFVDILKFLADGPLKGGQTPLQVLLGRRPDLEHIELMCENTSTQLPYVDLAREILEAKVSVREFSIGETAAGEISSVIGDLNQEKVPAGFKPIFAAAGYPLTDKGSVRKDGTNAWVILDTSWSFTVTYKGTGQGFNVAAWPQTSWTTEELSASPEHVNSAAYAQLRSAVYPWNLPLNLPVEESRVYLGHFGVKRHQVMETFFRSAPSGIFADKDIANEYIGMTKEEADIISGVKTGSGTTPAPWEFWGLKETLNDIADPTDGTTPNAKGNWDVVLQRVSIFLQQSGLAYRELLEVLGSYFINPSTAANGRTFGIVSTDTKNPATCNLSRLEIQVIDTTVSNKQAALTAAWKKIHRFVRLARRLGWTMRDLDKAIVALQPNSPGPLDITPDFLLKLSHIQRLRAQFGLPVVNLLSFWASIDTGKYLDQFSEGAPAVPSLYATLFNNKTAIGQSLPEDPNALTGKLSENKAIISAALQVSVDDVSLLIADTNVVAGDTLSLANLSALYRHATFARVLGYSVRTYLSALKVINVSPFAKPEDTSKFVQQSEKVRASGFSVEDLTYLLRHDFSATSTVAISDQAIALALSAIRDEVRKVAAENTFVEVADATNPATNDPNGDLTKRKLALLNWDSALIEQLVAVLNGTFTHETKLDVLPTGISFPESLTGKVAYDSVAKQLRFTGVMTAAEQGTLLALSTDKPYTDAVTALFNAPRTMVKRHMRRYSVPQFATPLTVLPGDVNFPDALKTRIYYDTAAKTLNFTGVMTEAERNLLSASSTDAAYKAAIEALFKKPDETSPATGDAFITDADVAALFDTIPAIAPPARFIIVLKKLLGYLLATLSERIVVQRIGEYLQLESQAANELLTSWVNSPVNTGQKAIRDLLAPKFVEDSNPNVEPTRIEFPAQFATFVLLYKIALVNHGFNLTPQQLQWLFDFVPGNTGWLDLNKLPLGLVATAGTKYDQWARLADLFKLRDALPLAETLLTDLFTSARNSTQTDPLLPKISNALSWKLENLQALNGTSGFSFTVNDYKDETALVRLYAAFTMLEQLGASADQCLSWTKPVMSEPDERKCAQDVKSLVRANLEPEQWLEKAKALNDPLREMQRAALVSFLLLPSSARNASELYDDFLIDVEMSPSMMTTRIKQAISSVQLFVQRSLMNLEAEVAMTPDEAKQWAEWRKQYRMWEANRKILLYPENWIEPELRDGKSPFYKELENELLQSDVTMDTAETAFLHYLERLRDVSRLEIVGMYSQQEAAANGNPATDVVHVIGRTFADPHTYYYRTQVDSTHWTPWEKVEADIQGNHVIPVIWNRRLYVFWPIFTVKQQDASITMPAAGEKVESGAKTLQVQLAWTEYKNGTWSPKKMAAPFVSQLKHPDKPLAEADFKLFSFKSREQTTPDGELQLFIDCYGPVENTSTITVKEDGTPPTTETYLFTLGAGKTKSVTASVKDGSFSAADVSRVSIIARNPITGAQIGNSLTLANDGTLDITNSTSASIKYYLSSAYYHPENIVVTGQKQVCWWVGGNTLPNLAGSNGDGTRTLFAVDTSVEPALVGTDTLVDTDTSVKPVAVETAAVISPTFIPRNGETQVCDIITEAVCEFDLIPIPIENGEKTVTITSLSPMQAIASFHFDDGQQSVTGLLDSTEITSLEPIVGTIFENMMMVEYQDPNNDGLGEQRILQATPTKFRLLGMHQKYSAKNIDTPYFFQDERHTYFLPQVATGAKVRFNSFFHPTVKSFVKSLNRSGISGLLTLNNQRLTDKPNDPAKPPTEFNKYQPDATKVDLGKDFTLEPREDVDFSYGGAYSSYNWELFFHAPFMIATQLSKNQRFEEAQKWFHYIFDPTATDSPDKPSSPGAERFWRVKPLYEEAMRGTKTLEELFADANALQAQVNEWMANPFNPHVIARLRLVTYMKAIVMRYIDNLIAWGDQLFRRDTIESINEATQLYILAAQILGRRPEQIPARAKTKVQTFRTLDDEVALNGLANAMVEIEGFLSPSVAPIVSNVPTMPFFGIPGNDKLLRYWDTVGDRLFKIRHSLNIDGVVRTLPTFEPPIDPGLLVRAANAGVDIASALTEINVALPHYRFGVMKQKAAELCNEVKALGSALLSALEKRDAEALALLRSTHEIKVLNAVKTIKEKQLDEAKETKTGLERSKEMATLRRDYYRDIEFMNSNEDLSQRLTIANLVHQGLQAFGHALAGTCNLIPQGTAGPFSAGVTWGGANLGSSASEYGSSLGMIGAGFGTGASMAATMGSYERRFDDWKLQESLANKEMEQIDKQIAAADIRIAIAEKELRNHELQVENTKEVDEFMRSKFTNRELYDWMVGQLSGIYFQSYQLAYDVAKRAERAYRYELGLKDSTFIQFGYWDSLKKGLLAGERLSYDLQRLEVAYMDQNKREYEIVKHVSLNSIDPVSLVKLKQTGECFVTLPEVLFDIDYSGHYMRRIKSVGLTVPCVAGPYSGVNCTLTLQSSTIRHSNTLSSGKYGRQADDLRFVDSAGTVQSIVTSGAQNDSGLFETNLHDERYLPFEGQGAISSWRIQLPRNFKTFDYNTISDVVLHVRYTAREGGAVLKMQAEQELQTALNEFIRIEGRRGLAQMFSLRHDFPTEWSRFLNVPSGTIQSLTAAITKERFPFLFQGRPITIKAIEVYTKVKSGFEGEYNKLTLRMALAAGATAPGPGDTLTLDDWNSLVRGTKDLSNLPGPFTLAASLTNGQPLNPDAIQDIVVVCRYTCA